MIKMTKACLPFRHSNFVVPSTLGIFHCHSDRVGPALADLGTLETAASLDHWH
jgi:hypothetical protein